MSACVSSKLQGRRLLVNSIDKRHLTDQRAAICWGTLYPHRRIRSPWRHFVGLESDEVEKWAASRCSLSPAKPMGDRVLRDSIKHQAAL